MAVGFAVASIGISAYGAYSNYKADTKLADAQKKIDNANLANFQKETGESIRRTQVQNDKTTSTAITQIGASGFGAGSSMDAYLQTLQKEQAADIDWMRTSGASQSAIMEREAAARKRNAEAARTTNLISNVGNIGMSAAGFKW